MHSVSMCATAKVRYQEVGYITNAQMKAMVLWMIPLSNQYFAHSVYEVKDT